jgi:GxxExxY protein
MSVGRARADVSTSAQAEHYAATTYKIIGAAMRVHNELGPGLKEAHYQRALSAALRDSGLSCEEEKAVEVTFGENEVGLLYLDHLVEDAIVVEEKAFSHMLIDEDVAQVITCLAVTEAPLGLLFNFGRRSLEYKRILAPKKFADWKKRIARYAWRPREADAGKMAPRVTHEENPLIGSSSADRKAI